MKLGLMVPHTDAGPYMTEGEARQMFYDLRAKPDQLTPDDVLALLAAFEDTYDALEGARHELENHK